jgi:ATP-dependent DNA helicase RecG
VRLLLALQGEMSRDALQQALPVKDAKHFRYSLLLPAIAAGWVEMTVPDKPRSSRQRHRLTSQGEALRSRLLKERAS